MIKDLANIRVAFEYLALIVGHKKKIIGDSTRPFQGNISLRACSQYKDQSRFLGFQDIKDCIKIMQFFDSSNVNVNKINGKFCAVLSHL